MANNVTKKNRKNGNNMTHSNNAAPNNDMTMGGKRKGKGKGKGKGKSKTKKRALSNGAKSWQKSVMEVYGELKAKNPNTKLKDAMKEAAKRKKKGQL